MLRTLPALLLIVGFAAACGNDEEPKAEETASATATPSATPTPTPTPASAPTATVAPAPPATKAAKPAAPKLSACAKIWTPGATLPVSYNGCPEEAGESSWEVEECYSGGKYATFWSANGTRYAAKLGGPVYEKVSDAGDDDYGYVLGECSND